MSVDLRTIRPQFKHILQNRKIIAVDQDPLGIQGRRIYKHKGIEIWSRPIGPLYQNFYSYAIAFVNRRTDGTPSDISVTLKELGLINYTGYRVEVCFGANFTILMFPTLIIEHLSGPLRERRLWRLVSQHQNQSESESVWSGHAQGRSTVSR